MDESKNRYKLIHEMPSKGDLVKIVNHEFTYDGENSIVLYGIVMGVTNEFESQLRMFREVQVYMLKTNVVIPVPIGGVQIISKIANNTST